MMPARAMTRSVRGPEVIQAARQMQARKQAEQWPYAWSYPPPNARNAMPSGSIAAPAAMTQAIVLSYSVPTGMRFFLIGLIQTFRGTGLVPGSTSAVWTLDRNTPLGLTPAQSSPIAYFTALSFPLGDIDEGPILLPMPEIFEAGDIIRSKVVTDGSITPGSPNFFISQLFGWTVPAD